MKQIILEMEKLKHLETGLGQFCFHLGNELLLQQQEQFKLNFFLPEQAATLFDKKVAVKFSKQWNKLFMPGASRFDLWHILHQDSKYIPASPKKMVITVHDLNFLQKYSGRKQQSRLQQLQSRIDRSSGVAVISNYTGSVLKNHIELKDCPLRVIYNGNSLKQFPHAQRPGFIQEDHPFFFALGVLSPRKNFHVLPPLLKRFPHHRLVIAGPSHSEYTQQILSAAKAAGVSSRLILVNQITEEEKYWLYANMDAFLFPSLAEGFGLPVVEAMSLGKPVFLSNLTSLPEVGGEMAFYFKNFDAEEMANQLETGLHKVAHISDYSSLVKQHAHQFSWQNAAKEYLNFYSEVLS